MYKTVVISILLSVSPLFASDKTIKITFDKCMIQLNKDSGKISSSKLLGPKNSQPGGIKYFDGKKKKELILPAEAINSSDSQYIIKRTPSSDGLIATETITLKDGYILWRVDCKNTGSENKWLEITLDVPSGDKCKNLLYWDGFVEKPVSRFHCHRQGVFLTFPATFLRADKGENGLMMGINPLRDYSYISSSAKSHQMLPNAPVTMSYSVRIVIDPSKTETAEFVIGVIRSDYGVLNAVQKYYDLFPEAFYPKKGIDPRLLGAGRYIYGKNGLRNLQLEFARRMNLSWEWSYGVFQTPGDWFPDKKYWKNEKGYPGKVDSHRNPTKGSIVDYMRDTSERFLEGRKSIAMMFYLLPQNCDKTILEKYYPDSFFYTGRGKKSLAKRGAIKVKEDYNIDCWFSPATSYGRDMRNDMQKVAKFFHPRGFAFDCAHGSELYGGPLVGKSRARAWNNNGEYALTGIEMVDLYKWVHSMKVDGYTLGVATNLTYSYMVFREADALMFEPAAFREKDYKARRIPMRFLAGHKMLNIHKGVMREAHDILRWEKLTPQEVILGLKGMVDYQLLWCFRYGAFPTDDILGIKKVHSYAPMLLDMNRQGWQAIPAATANADLWISRYGKGLNTKICIGNPKRFNQKTNISVDMNYLSQNNYIFSLYDGRSIPNNFIGQSNTIEISIDSHEVAAIESIISIGGPPLQGTGEVLFDKYSTKPDTITAKINLDKPTSSRSILIKLPDNSIPKNAFLNNTEIQYTHNKTDSTINFNSPLKEKNEIVINYIPQVIIEVSSKKLCDIPYTKSDLSPNIIIACDKNSYLQAERIAAYFEYWYLLNKYPASKGVISNFPRQSPKVKIFPLNKIPDDYTTAFIIAENKAENHAAISLDEKEEKHIIKINGPNQAILSQAISNFLNILDSKYPYYGFLGNTPFLKKAGLSGKVLE